MPNLPLPQYALLGFKYVAISSNKKTGNIPQTYTCKGSCPTNCPFLGFCYGSCGHTNIHWQNGCTISLDQLRQKVKATTEKGQLLRHNVAGDIAVSGTSEIDVSLVKELSETFKGLNAYTYTHVDINTRSAAVIKRAAESGFLINASCEKLAQVQKAKSLGINTVITVTELTESLKAKAKEKGISLVKCLNDKGLTCKQCRICAKDRESTIVFETHGSGKKKLDAIINQIKDY